MNRIDRLIWEANGALAALEPENAESRPARLAGMPPVRRRPRRALRFAVAAAAAAALLAGAAYAAGALGWIPGWDDGTFWFSPAAEAESPEPPPAERPFAGLAEALAYYGAPEHMIPSYMPAGYTLTEFECHASKTGHVYFLTLWQDGAGGAICVDYILYTSTAQVFYSKDEGDPEIYAAGGVEHYVMTSADKYMAVWRRGDFEGSLSGFSSREELIKTIDSMYRQ